MIAWGNYKSTILIFTGAVILFLTAAGCLETNQRVAQASAKTQSHAAMARPGGPARHYALAERPAGHTNGFDFTQVSLFGDLPGLPATPFKANAGPSLQQHTFAVEGACFDPVVSRDGRMLAFASTQHNVKPDIYVKPTGLATMTQLTSDPASDLQPCFSPDGERVAFCSDRSGNWDLYAAEIRGGKLEQLTDDPAPEMHPSFSADGTQVAYCRYNLRSGQWEIWVVDLADGQRRFITAGLFPTFSPIDRQIAYQRAKQRGSRWFSVWVIELRESGASMPTEVASSANLALTTPRWSPDGQYLVYAAVRPDVPEAGRKTADAQVWIVRTDGTGKRPVTDPGIGSFTPVWSSDNRIFFCANRGGCENIWSVLPMIGRQGAAEANTPVKIEPAHGQDQHHPAG